MGMPSVVSLFAGCGGSSLGYKLAGYKELLAVDFDKNAEETFRLNFPDVPFWNRDISQLPGKEIIDFVGGFDVLDGSPPCQGFSMAGKRKIKDKRNNLVFDFIRLLEETKPKAFVMENVASMRFGKMAGIYNE